MLVRFFVIWTVLLVAWAPPVFAQVDGPSRSKGDVDSLMRGIESFLNVHHESIFADPDADLRAEFASMNEELLRRSDSTDVAARELVYRNLFQLVRSDSLVGADSVSAIVNGLATFASSEPRLAFAQAPLFLAERTRRFAEASRLVRQGLDSVFVQMERDRAWFEDDSLFQAMRDEQISVLTDALGWIHHLAGRQDSALVYLDNAHALWSENPVNLYHLGRLNEHAGDLEAAEHYYRLGSLAVVPGDNPNRTALRDLYEKTRGNLDGWEAYEAQFESADREMRRSMILAARRPRPDRLPGFELSLLGGGTYSSDDLAGRVAVINFWGVWCSWCVREMPDVQALHERYADSTGVVILTINNDSDREMATDWIKEHGYDFAVLWDEGFASRDANVTGYPTTWFIDPDGYVVYEQRGWTEKLLEEFTWRIEEIRNSRTQKE